MHGRETVFAFKMDFHRANRNLANEKEQIDYVQEVLQELQHVDSFARTRPILDTTFN